MRHLNLGINMVICRGKADRKSSCWCLHRCLSFVSGSFPSSLRVSVWLSLLGQIRRCLAGTFWPILLFRSFLSLQSLFFPDPIGFELEFLSKSFLILRLVPSCQCLRVCVVWCIGIDQNLIGWDGRFCRRFWIKLFGLRIDWCLWRNWFLSFLLCSPSHRPIQLYWWCFFQFLLTDLKATDFHHL